MTEQLCIFDDAPRRWQVNGEVVWHGPGSPDRYRTLPSPQSPVVIHYCGNTDGPCAAMERMLSGFERWTLHAHASRERLVRDGIEFTRLGGNFVEYSSAFSVSVLCGTTWHRRLVDAFDRAKREPAPDADAEDAVGRMFGGAR